MKINWFTVIAQIINFLILVWLLKRYLYKPILDSVDEREKKISDELADAKAKEAKAKKEQHEFKHKNDEFDKQKTDLMAKAVEEAKEQRLKLLEEARTEATALHTKLDTAFKESEENMKSEIAEKTQQQVFAITRKALADVASVTLEEHSVTVFIKRLHELKAEEKKIFISSFKSHSNPILVRSAFDLSEKQKDKIEKAVNDVLDTEAQFQFNTSPELISGIVLTANGYKLAWSISDYLTSLEKNISEKTEEKEKPEVEKK